MPAKTMPSGGLSAASNPSARLQELLRNGPAEPAENTEKYTETHTEIIAEDNAELNTSLHTEALTQSSTESLSFPLTEALTSSSAEVPPSVRTQRRKTAMREASASSAASAPAASVRQRIAEDLQKEPVVRKTIDIPASLNERLQDYCAAKRIKTERRVFLVLLENFLEEEGF